MIRIDHVTFSYGEENENAGGVHDINLTVEDGQCVVLCGESGKWKNDNYQADQRSDSPLL